MEAQVTSIPPRTVAWGPCAVLAGVRAVVTKVLDSSVLLQGRGCDVGTRLFTGRRNAASDQETQIPGSVSGPRGAALFCDH